MPDVNPLTEFWLRGVWSANGGVLYQFLNTKTVTGDEVRNFVKNWIEGASRFSAAKVRYWQDLTDNQRDDILAKAFPDNQYQLSDDGPDPVFSGQ